MSASTRIPIHTHPDLVSLREHYDRAAEHPPAQITDGLLLITGLYTAASAWIIGFAGQTALAVTNLIAGLAVVALAVGFGSAFGRTHGMAFVAPLLGIWLIVSPWIVAGVTTSTAMIWSNVVAGALVCVLGLAATAMGTGLLQRSR